MSNPYIKDLIVRLTGGYEEAKGDAEDQIESLISDHEDWPENVISTLEDFEVER